MASTSRRGSKNAKRSASQSMTTTPNKKTKSSQDKAEKNHASKSIKSKPEVEASPKIKNENESSKYKVEEFTTDELITLIANVESNLPKNDSLRFNTSAAKFNWEAVKFGRRSANECAEKWDFITKKLRRYRTMSELVVEAQDWVRHPWTSHSSAKKLKRHPDMPKKPLTPYFKYFLEKRQKYGKLHPEMTMTDLAKLIAVKFNELSVKKKSKYQEVYAKECEVYKENLEKFKKDHPEFSFNSNKKKIQTNGIDKPLTPFQLFKSEKLGKLGNLDISTRLEAIEKIKKHWNALSESKRVKWIRKAYVDETRYFSQIEDYRATHPSFVAPVIKSSITKFERELKDKFDGKPEKPPNSGYSLYSKIMLKELNDFPSKDKMSEISRRWKGLNEEERKSYKSQSAEMMESYKELFQAYLDNLSSEEREKALIQTKKKKKEVIPESIKDVLKFIEGKGTKPNSTLFHFQADKFHEYEAKNPQMSKIELLKLIHSDYKSLPMKKKEKYDKIVEANLLDSKDTKLNASSKAKVKELQKMEPKKPPQNAYSLFTTEMLRELTTIEPRKRMSEIAKRWKDLDAKEKQTYKERSTELMNKYHKDLAKFLKNLSPYEHMLYESTKGKTKKEKAAVKETKSESSEDETSSVMDDSQSSSSSDDSESSSDEEDNKDSDSDDESSSDDSDNSDSGSSESESSDDSDGKK